LETCREIFSDRHVWQSRDCRGLHAEIRPTRASRHWDRVSVLPRVCAVTSS
jgi:hypothetical protein